jgi:D-alanyl-D-alanine carboxypeptidase
MVRCFAVRSTVLAIAFAAFCLAGCTAKKASHAAGPTALQRVVDADWVAFKSANGLPGGGVAVYLETPKGNFYASADMAAGTDQNTHFRIASNTKTFTAAAIMLLNQQGKLNIDDLIVATIPGQNAPYAPDTASYNIPNKASITIRQLLSHTAGVFDVTNSAVPAGCAAAPAGQNYVSYVLAQDPNHQFTFDELVGVDAECQLSDFAPGADYAYTNTGFSILGEIVERVSGQAYDQFVTENLLSPNGLAATSIPMLATDQTLPPPFSPGYVFNNGVLMDLTAANMSAPIATGNLISTPADLARWVTRLIEGKAGPDAASVGEMMTTTPQSHAAGSDYGLGLFPLPGLGYGHNGAFVGYLSLMMYDPTVDVALIVYFDVWDDPGMSDEYNLLNQLASDARAAVGY